MDEQKDRSPEATRHSQAVSVFWKVQRPEPNTDENISAFKMNNFRDAFSGMKWADVVSCLEETIIGLLADTADPPPSPPDVPAGFEPNAHPQEERECEEYPPFEKGLDLSDLLSPSGSTFLPFQTVYGEDITLPEDPHGQEGDHSQEQYLPFELPVDNYPPAAEASPISYPVAAPQPCNMEPLTPSESLEPNIKLIGVNSPDLLSEFRASIFEQTPPVFGSKKRQRGSTEDEDRPYVKKPPNAFMLYMKEQRPYVPAEILERGSAAVNVFLGQTWRSMSKDEQTRYYQQADIDSRLHSQLHPEWSTTDNYGKKRRRLRRRAQNVATKEVMEVAESSSSNPQVDAAPMMMEVTDPSTSQTGVQGINPLQTVLVLQTQTDITGQTVLVQLPDIQTPLSVSVCHGCYLPQVFMASSGSLMA